MPSSSTVTVTASSVADTTKSASATVTLTPASGPVSVTISPTSANVALGGSQPFTATVTSNANTAVTWSVNGILNGNSTVGTVNGGQYQAPASMPSSSTVTVTATSVADNTKSASATVTLTAPASGPSISSIAP